jgi:DNA-directed RNA polymerase specialized sigma24 family protein
MTRAEAESLLTKTLPIVRRMAATFIVPRIKFALVDYARDHQCPLGWSSRNRELPAIASLEGLGRRAQQSGEDGPEFAAVDYRAPEYSEEPAEFEYLISFLASRNRAVLRMIYRQGMKHEEIAAELHCCTDTVHNVHVRSLELLRERWKQAA